MSVAIVVLDSLAVPFLYEAEEPQQGNWSGEWGNPLIAVHVKVPEGLDPHCIMAVRDSETGEITLVEDPAKVQARLDTAWASLRAERNRHLAACDWTQLADAHLSQDKKDAWATYRQELRDLPESVTDPTGPSVSWPLDPTQTPPTPVTGSRLESLMSVAG
jgi:hypothetical protein